MLKLPASDERFNKLRRNGIFKRSGNILRQGIQVSYHMIERCRDSFPVKMMCRHLDVSSTGYYDWRVRMPSQRAIDNDRLLSRIRKLHADSDGVMGAPRIWEEFRDQDETCGLNRAAQNPEIGGITSRRQ